MASQPSTQRRQDRAITFLTQEEVQRLFSAIKTKRDRAIFAVAYRHGLRASEVDLLVELYIALATICGGDGKPTREY